MCLCGELIAARLSECLAMHHLVGTFPRLDRHGWVASIYGGDAKWARNGTKDCPLKLAAGCGGGKKGYAKRDMQKLQYPGFPHGHPLQY